MTHPTSCDPIARSVQVSMTRVSESGSCSLKDHLAIEEPLEIRVEALDGAVRTTKSIAITMRTPGHDGELAAGFLLTEGVIRSTSDLLSIKPCGADAGAHQGANRVRVVLADSVRVDWSRLERLVYAASSCGVCGKRTLDALEVQGLRPMPRTALVIPRELIRCLHDRVRAHQSTFNQTGGLHAAALFDRCGELIALREDVGRHNAVDKVLGSEFLACRSPSAGDVLFLSGRASFELVQKALVARIPVVVAVGAPSTLAVELAARFEMTLIGFVRDDRFNVYHGDWRVMDMVAEAVAAS